MAGGAMDALLCKLGDMAPKRAICYLQDLADSIIEHTALIEDNQEDSKFKTIAKEIYDSFYFEVYLQQRRIESGDATPYEAFKKIADPLVFMGGVLGDPIEELIVRREAIKSSIVMIDSLADKYLGDQL